MMTLLKEIFDDYVMLLPGSSSLLVQECAVAWKYSEVFRNEYMT